MIDCIESFSEIYEYANDMLALIKETSDTISKFDKG